MITATLAGTVWNDEYKISVHTAGLLMPEENKLNFEKIHAGNSEEI